MRWQLENINNNYLLPIDYDAYKQLKNHIAKALVPLLQIWLYASRQEPCQLSAEQLTAQRSRH